VGAALGVLLFAATKAPAIDEESYLWMGRNLDLLRPYDWVRTWPPYDDNAWAWAHPPLHLYWMKLCTTLADGPVLRLLAGAPWVALLAASVAKLAARTTHHPGLAAGLWLASPIVVLGIQDTWMIDLPAVALLTAALAAYREGLVDEEERWFIASGILLGLAIETKYTMGVVVPVLAFHQTRLGPRPKMWLAAAGVIAAVELPLLAVYGGFHPWEVFTRRGEIAAGPFAGRLLGALTRGALLALPLALLRANPALLAAGGAVGIVAVLAARPSQMPVTTATLLVLLAALGAALFARAVQATLTPPGRRRKGDRGDPLLLGGWALAVLLGVVLLHNYASARYLLPAAAPIALLLTRSGEEFPWGKALLRGSIAVATPFALLISFADHRFAGAGAEVAAAAVKSVTDAGGSPGRFAGEWSFRGVMESAGWTRYRPDESLPAGTWVVVAENASAGALPADDWEPVERFESRSHFPVRVVDIGGDVGLYAETLGTLPFGLRKGAVESATVYRVRARGETLGAGAGGASDSADGAPPSEPAQ
jgi:hypothetical protein